MFGRCLEHWNCLKSELLGRARLSYQYSAKYDVPEPDMYLPNTFAEACTFYSRFTRNSNLGFSSSGAIPEIFLEQGGKRSIGKL